MTDQIKSTPGGRSLLKPIFQALIILAISVGVSQGLLFPIFQDRALSSVQRWEVEYLTSGTIDLLADQLTSLPESARADHIAMVAGDFGFDIDLRDLATIDLKARHLERLARHEAVGDPQTQSAYKRLKDGDQVLVFDRTGLPARHLIPEAQRRHMGTLAVLERLLQERPPERWNETISDAALRFGYPVRLIALTEATAATGRPDELQDSRMVAVETDDSVTADYPAEFVYKRIGDKAIVLGPFSPPTLKRFYPLIVFYYSILGIVILVPLGLWLAPTWRSMNRLSGATAAFGQGNFTARANPIRGSKFNDLIEVFNQMAGKIQGLVESNKALINAVSHELRTPISRIEFNIELARQSTDISERNQQLDRIEESVDELKTMVSEMLLYARFDREKPNFSMTSVDVGEWLRSERRNWGCGDSVLDIRIVAPETPASVSLERYYMSRAISNLVRNAMRFAKSLVTIEAGVNNGVVEISVSDDGPGIGFQERTRVFEPFVRLDDSRNRDSGGTGLGLAIVRQIVAWHSGDVRVDDSAYGGARFVVCWPVQEGV